MGATEGMKDEGWGSYRGEGLADYSQNPQSKPLPPKKSQLFWVIGYRSEAMGWLCGLVLKSHLVILLSKDKAGLETELPDHPLTPIRGTGAWTSTWLCCGSSQKIQSLQTERSWALAPHWAGASPALPPLLSSRGQSRSPSDPTWKMRSILSLPKSDY